ncbi:glycoside hydrolase family 3 N-terminal domain-containing protein [Aliivibrio fischeri]|uniref:glycoside hydrolase family 3 N-terminal domain-containing protein n=1 Tax=Aliivibrio fischeri TaxID=668 RepID=UPI001F3429BA|nr:glycoside hydrolase family 3 N-terminal domain-containing protein [Aliivibrio fischeri]MCE7555182.1 glycoside hydrolase family 3 protein [Aliivibrio fischeri]MCE7562450.1 glycoside hydrolase family 3 protein [Aliivibrio fischeri]MCE7569858.1 glycoside hydrolase family 3 protein [Aliivibrio fischeri]
MFRIVLFSFVYFLSLPVFSVTTTPLADSYIERNGLKKSVAQLLFTGVIADYNNFSYNKKTKELLNLNVGGVIINAYNIPVPKNRNNRDNSVQIIKNFTQSIRRSHVDGNDLLLAVDFESYKYSSLRYPLVPPPSALTISANNSTQSAFIVGKDTGMQLESIGVNVLLGPVLDKDSKVQGTRNTNLMNRSFGSDSKIISVFASEFIRGVSNNRVATFAKHFPGYGFVEANPHLAYKVDINASKQAIIDDLKPFSDTSSLLSGVMTSHLYLNRSQRPLTVSKRSLGSLINHEQLKSISQKVIITDDISGMAAIQKYKNDDGISNSRLVLNAFKAGHDFILISHLEHHSSNKFTVDDVKKSIDTLEEYAGTEDGLARLKLSLEKILILKKEVSLKPQLSHKLNSDSLNEIESRALEIYKRATINVSSTDVSTSTNIMDFVNSESKVYIVGDPRYFDSIKSNVPASKNTIYIELNTLKKGKAKGANLINNIGQKLSKIVADGNYLVFLVSSRDSYNILESLRLNNADPSKVLVSVHGSPLPIETATLLNYKVITNFDYAPISSYPLGLIINGDLAPENIHNSPLELGNGAIFQLSDRKDIEYSGSDSDLTKKISKEGEDNLDVKIWLLILPVLLIFGAKIISMTIFSCHAKCCDNIVSRRTFWREALLSRSYIKRKFVIFLLLFLGFIAMPMFISSPGEFSYMVESSNYVFQDNWVKNTVDLLITLDEFFIRL